MDPLIGLYLTIAIIALMVAYAGVEGTMRVFYYLDLQLRFAYIRIRMHLMANKLKRQLVKDTNNYKKLIEELKNDQ